MPGVSVDDSSITYRGQRIDRILFNGTNLFGKDIGNAMDMVLADEVKSMKVYDRKAADDLEDDGLSAKERVLDVRTWKPLEHVGSLVFGASGGMFTSRNADGGFDWSTDGMLQIGSYSLGARPRISAEVGGGHNSLGGQPAMSPRDEFNAVIRVGKDVAGKFGYTHSLNFRGTGGSTSGSSIQTFSPSDAWTERADTSVSRSRNRICSAAYSGDGYFRKGKTSIRLNGSLSYGKSMRQALNGSSSWTDGKWTGYRKSIGDTTDAFQGGLSTRLTRTFGKRGRRMETRAGISGSMDWGHGERLDSLKNSISREWLSNSLNSWKITPSLTWGWDEPVGKKSVLNVSAAASYVRGSTRKLFTDGFDGSLNLINSEDFTSDNISGTLSATYRYGRKNDGLYALVTLGFRGIAAMRDEKLAGMERWHRNYFRPVVEARLSYGSGNSDLSFVYSEQESVPSVQQLRSAVKDDDPLFLRAGNPDLALPVRRRAELKYGQSFPERNIVLEFKADGSLHSNAIVSRTVYFTEQTLLAPYGYLAPAGSSLTTPVNVSGCFDAGAAASYRQYFSRADLNVGVDLSWRTSGSPFYLYDVLYLNSDNSVSMSVPLGWSGENASLSFSPSAGLGRNRRDGVKLYDSMNLSGTFSYIQRIGRCIEFTANAEAVWMDTTRKDLGIFTHNVSCSLAWLFGKDRRCRLGVFGSNLTSLVRSTNIAVTDNYILKSMSDSFGRSVGISFTCSFSKR